VTGKIRQQVNASVRGQENVFGGGRQSLIFWDLSEEPKDNKDRNKKLGACDLTHGMAFTKFDKKTHGSIPADGFTNKSPKDISSWRVFEPDNWMLRLHDEKKENEDGVWSTRLIADHCNASSSRKHRGTMIIDAHEKQKWAFTQDAWWVVDLEASVMDKELFINDAGFLEMLTDNVSKTKTRGALAGNIARNAGYLTDGQEVTQWWHILSPVKVGGTRPEACGAPNIKTENALRSDVYFNTAKRRWVLCPKGDTVTVYEAGSYVAIGQLFLVPPNDPTAKPLVEGVLDTAADSTSNQPIIPRKEAWRTKVYVLYNQPKVPPKHQYPPAHTTTGHMANPFAPPVPTGEGSGLPMTPTVDTSHGATSEAHAFMPGDFQGIEVKWPIPEGLQPKDWMEVIMEFSVRAAYTGIQATNMSFMYRATAQNTTPGVYTQVDKAINAASGLAAGKWKHGTLVIPHSVLEGNEGGVFELWVITKSSSTGPQFILGEFHASFANQGTEPAGGFTFD
jgi:hypothetical protein